MLKRIILSVCVIICLVPALAIADYEYEFSFGTSQMFINELDRRDVRGESQVVLPTTSALFIGERIWGPRWSTIIGYNLPLETQKFIVDGLLVEEVAATVLSVGQAYRVLSFRITQNSILSFQIGALASFLFGEAVEITPTAGLRMHLVTDTGFAMYFGGLASYGLKGGVLMYGIGHRF